MQSIIQFMIILILLNITIGCGDDDSETDEPISTQIEADEIYFEGARFSPDGNHLVVIYPDPETNSRTIAVMDVDGENKTVITDGWNYLTYPAWSSDGDAIFFSGDGISRVNTDGTSQEQVFSDTSTMDPDLSRDDEYIVYARHRATIQLKELDSQDSPVDTNVEGRNPRFSPDGSQIAFASAGAIRIMNRNGDNLRDLVDFESNFAIESVAWLPDGERLAMTSDLGIEVVDIEDGSRTIVYEGRFSPSSLDVSADGNRLLFTDFNSPHLTILERF